MKRARFASFLFVFASSTPSIARADVKADCLSAYEKAQVEKKEAHLVTAREQLLVCAQDACPAVVKKDCTPWLAEIDQAVPTVLLIAKDAKGKDLVDVKVFADGFLVASSLDGMAHALDPGKHVFRFEGGGAIAEETVILREGEKRRAVSVTLGSAVIADAAPAHAAPPATVTEPPSEQSSGGSKLPAIGVGLLGLAAITTGVVIGAGAKSDADDLRSTCAPFCEQSKIDDVHSKLIVSDVALGVGVVAVGVAVVLWIVASPSEPSRKTGRIDGPLRIRF